MDPQRPVLTATWPLPDDASQALVLLKMLQNTLDVLPLIIATYEVCDGPEFRMVFANRRAFEMSGFAPTDLIGKYPQDYLPPEEARYTNTNLQTCLTTGQIIEAERVFHLPKGTIWLHATYLPQYDADERISRITIITQDVTERKLREAADQEQREIIAQQSAAIAELSTPLLSVADKTLVMPLIGAVDSRRVQQMMDTLLSGVADSRAQTVILDITGVSIVDTQVASALLRAAQAAGLLGAKVVLTGIRPEVAQTIVGLGIDLTGIITRGTLRDGIAYAL